MFRNNFPEKPRKYSRNFGFFFHFPNETIQLELMTRFSQLSLIFLLSIVSFVYESSSSSIINPSKVKQVSSKPRSIFCTPSEVNHISYAFANFTNLARVRLIAGLLYTKVFLQTKNAIIWFHL